MTAPNSYSSFEVYSTDPVTFQLPAFGTSTYAYQLVAPVKDLLSMGAVAAEYRVAMPAGFKLDATTTNSLNSSRPFTISQDATTGEIVLTYKDLTTATADTTYANVYVAGSFTDYVDNTTVTATTPNIVTVKIDGGSEVVMQSTANNVFNYVDSSKKSAAYTSMVKKDYQNNKDSATTVYVDLQRANNQTDELHLSSGFTSYYGPAIKNASNVITVPDGFSATAITVTVSQRLLDADGVTTLPYQVNYSDGTTDTGTLSGATNTIALNANKTVESIAYQYDIPAIAKIGIQQSAAEPVTGKKSTIQNSNYISLPTTNLTLTAADSVTAGSYKVGSTLTGTDTTGQAFKTNGDLTIQVIDGMKDAYVSLAAKGQTQTSTSAGDLLTGVGSSGLSRANLYPTDGLALSNGETSSSSDSLANFLNQPVFYFVAPAQTHFVVDKAIIEKDIPGIQLTSYVTKDGHQAYKIDLSQATSQPFSISGDFSYSDSDPMGTSGVFRLDLNYGIVERLVNLFEIQADPDAVAGSDDLRIYYTSENQIHDISSGQDTDGAMTGDANAIVVPVANATYTIQNMSGIFGLTMIQGSNDSGYSQSGTASIYQPLVDNQFAVNVQNLTTTPLTNVSELINLPTAGDELGSAFAVQLVGAAAEVPTGVTVLYSTNTGTQGTQPTITGYVTEENVSDWSAIKSILIQTTSLAANTSLGRIVFAIQDPTQTADINKTAYFESGIYADGMQPVILSQAAAASLTIKGTATIKYAFLLPDGTKVPATTLTQTVAVGTDKVGTPTIKSTDLPTGYRLINATTGQAITSTSNTASYKVGTVDNSTADYTSIGGTNGVAVVGQVATYDADGDTVLIPLVDTNMQTMTFKYIDDTTGTTLTTASTTGMSLTAVSTSFKTATQIITYKNAGYVLVSDATTGQTLVFDADTTTDQVYEIHLKHGTTVADINTPGNPGSPIIPTGTAKWPTGTTLADLKDTVTRTIHYVYNDGSTAAPDKEQTATFMRAAAVDTVTGDFLGYLATNEVATYKQDATKVTLAATGKWTPASNTLAAVTNPTPKAGYATTDTVTTKTVQASDADSEQTVTYTPMAQVATVTYVDQDNKNQVLKTDTLNGITGGTLDYTTARNTLQTGFEKQGYVYVSETGNALGAKNIVTFDTDAKTNQNTTIYLKHNLVVATPDQPGTPIDGTPQNWPNGTTHYDLERTITERVQFVYANGGKVAADQVQTVTFERAAIVDQVTGTLLGYLDPAQVAAYQTDPASVTLSATNGWVAPAGDTFAAPTMPKVAAGYEAAPGAVQSYQVTPTTGNLALTVTYTGTPQIAYVTYIDEDNNNQELHFDEFQEPAHSTHNYTNVRNAMLAGYSVLGYVFDYQEGNSLDEANIITFDADQVYNQNTNIYLKHATTVVTPEQPQTPGEPLLTTPNQWPNEAGSQNLARTVTQTIHYVYSGGTQAAADVSQNVTFQRAAIVDNVTGTVLGYLAPTDVAAYQKDPTSVTLSQDAWTVTAGNPNFVSTQSPNVKAGYTPNVTATDAYVVTPSTGNADLTITYTADAQKATVTYVDADNGNQVLQTDILPGTTGSTVDYTKARNAIQSGYEKLGYVYSSQSGNALNGQNVVTFDADQTVDQATTIYLKHGHLTVTPEQPQTPGDQIPNNPNTWPAGTNTLDLNRTVTAIAQFVYSTGGKVGPDQSQVTHFTRTAVVDQVTGALLGYLAPNQVAAYQADPTSVALSTTGGWNIAEMPTDFTVAYSQPGYTPDRTAFDTYVLTPTSGDLKLTVTYTPDAQKATITYVDLTNGNQVLHVDHLNGVTGGKEDYSQVRQAVLAGFTDLGYVYDHQQGDALNAANVVAFDTHDDTDQNTTIYLTHGSTVVTPNQPQTPGEQIPNNPNNWPSGTDTFNLVRTVTQTVQYVYSDGGKVVADKQRQVTFQRAAIVDTVTGTLLGYVAPGDVVVYQANPAEYTFDSDGWTITDGSAAFISITSPQASRKGYSPNLAATQAYVVTPTTGNQVLTVTYTPDAQNATVTYVDADNGNKVLQTDTLPGTTGGTLDYTKARNAIQSGYEALGYVYSSQSGNALNRQNVVTFDADATKDQATTIYLKHKILAVTPDQPETPGTQIPNNPNPWPDGVNTRDLTRTVTETIQYVYVDGGKVAPDYQTSLTFQRVALVDAVTGTVAHYLSPADLTTYTTQGAQAVSYLGDNDWAALNGVTFDNVYSPAGKAGYTADVTRVKAYQVSHNTGDLNLTVTYTANRQKAKIQYVDLDANNAILQTKGLTGTTGSTFNYNAARQAIEAGYAQLGYVVDHTENLPADNVLTFDNQTLLDQTVTIYLKHQTLTVTPEQPQTPATQIPNNPNTWPMGTSTQDLNRTVTETVQYVYADGGKASADQTHSVQFQRAAVVDAVTGNVLGYLAPDQVAAYTADPASVTLSETGWNQATATFAALVSPAAKAGYTVDLTATQAYTVTPTTGNLALTVTYTPDAQYATIQYVDLDANGAVLQSKVLKGVSNATLAYGPARQAIQAGYEKLGYVVAKTNLPSDNVITFDADDTHDQSFTVYLQHGTTTVTPDQPQTPTTAVPNQPNITWPAGVNTQDLNRTVTETIQYVYADGGKAAADYHNSVQFQQVAIVDNVTGSLLGYIAPDQVTAYTADPARVAMRDQAWTPTTANFVAVNSPAAKAGYTADQATVSAYAVTPQTGNLALTVTYQADAQTAVMRV